MDEQRNDRAEILRVRSEVETLKETAVSYRWRLEHVEVQQGRFEGTLEKFEQSLGKVIQSMEIAKELQEQAKKLLAENREGANFRLSRLQALVAVLAVVSSIGALAIAALSLLQQ